MWTPNHHLILPVRMAPHPELKPLMYDVAAAAASGSRLSRARTRASRTGGAREMARSRRRTTTHADGEPATGDTQSTSSQNQSSMRNEAARRKERQRVVCGCAALEPARYGQQTSGDARPEHPPSRRRRGGPRRSERRPPNMLPGPPRPSGGVSAPQQCARWP